MSGQAPQLAQITPPASAEEAAAIAAALEQFSRATAAPFAPAPRAPDAWRRAAILEGVARADQAPTGDPWINT